MCDPELVQRRVSGVLGWSALPRHPGRCAVMSGSSRASQCWCTLSRRENMCEPELVQRQVSGTLAGVQLHDIQWSMCCDAGLQQDHPVLAYFIKEVNCVTLSWYRDG